MYFNHSKYNSKRTTVGTETFDSKMEARRWLRLLEMEKAGKISNLKRQVHRTLIPRQVTKSGKVLYPAEYVSDFEYDTQDGEHIVEDVKSKATITSTYTLKKKLLYLRFGIEIKEVYTA